jgi:hypothetical protein
LSKLLTIDPAVIRRLNSLPKHEKIECLLALFELPDSFGRPHTHSGLGIRKLARGIFECRGNLSMRFLFEARPSDLYIFLLGNHDEVKIFLRSPKFR